MRGVYNCHLIIANECHILRSIYFNNFTINDESNLFMTFFWSVRFSPIYSTSADSVVLWQVVKNMSSQFWNAFDACLTTDRPTSDDDNVDESRSARFLTFHSRAGIKSHHRAVINFQWSRRRPVIVVVDISQLPPVTHISWDDKSFIECWNDEWISSDESQSNLAQRPTNLPADDLLIWFLILTTTATSFWPQNYAN